MDNRYCVMPEKEINQIKEKFISELSPVKIYLFGSFATGTANDDSDFDFYIIVNDDTKNLVDLTAEAYKSIRSVRSRAVDIVIGTESRFERRKKMIKLGKKPRKTAEKQQRRWGEKCCELRRNDNRANMDNIKYYEKYDE